MPAFTEPGIVTLIVPPVVPTINPISVGLEKLPVALLSWAVNTLPGIKLPVTLKSTVNDDPVQNGDPEIGWVVIVWATLSWLIPKKEINKTRILWTGYCPGFI